MWLTAGCIRCAGRQWLRSTHCTALIDAGLAVDRKLQQTLRAASRDPALQVAFSAPGPTGSSTPRRAWTPLPAERPSTTVRHADRRDVPGNGDAASPESLRQAAARSTTLVPVVRPGIQLGQALREAEIERHLFGLHMVRGATPTGTRSCTMAPNKDGCLSDAAIRVAQ